MLLDDYVWDEVSRKSYESQAVDRSIHVIEENAMGAAAHAAAESWNFDS